MQEDVYALQDKMTDGRLTQENERLVTSLFSHRMRFLAEHTLHKIDLHTPPTSTPTQPTLPQQPQHRQSLSPPNTPSHRPQSPTTHRLPTSPRVLSHPAPSYFPPSSPRLIPPQTQLPHQHQYTPQTHIPATPPQTPTSSPPRRWSPRR